MTVVRKTAVIPYYWRVGAAVLHGTVASSLTYVGLREPRSVGWMAWLGGGLTVLALVLMLAVP